MCISDYRLGRQIRSQLDQYVVVTGTPQVIPRSPDRVGIRFATATQLIVITSTCIITVDGVTVAKLFSSETMVDLWLTEHGDLVTKEFTITVSGTSHTVGVTQFILPESVIAAALSEFSRSQ